MVNRVKLTAVSDPKREHVLTARRLSECLHILFNDCLVVDLVTAGLYHAHLNVNHDVCAISVLGRQSARSQEILSRVGTALTHGEQ